MFSITVENEQVWLQLGDMRYTFPPDMARELGERILIAAEHAQPSGRYVLTPRGDSVRP